MSAILGAALWKGGPDERFAAVAFLAAWAATVVFRDDERNNPQWGILVADIGLFVALVVLVLRTDRFWPIWMAGFELLSVITHAGRIVDRNVGAWAYITAGHIWGYLTLFALAWGTWTAWRERQLIERADPTGAPGATRR